MTYIRRTERRGYADKAKAARKGDERAARIRELKRKEPELSYATIAERFGMSRRHVIRILGATALLLALSSSAFAAPPLRDPLAIRTSTACAVLPDPVAACRVWDSDLCRGAVAFELSCATERADVWEIEANRYAGLEAIATARAVATASAAASAIEAERSAAFGVFEIAVIVVVSVLAGGALGYVATAF